MPILDLNKLFDGIRRDPFPNKLKAITVKNIEAVVNEWEKRALVTTTYPNTTTFKFLAYMLATNLGECGQDMEPVREGFKKTDAEARAYVKRRGYKYAIEINGHVYYGRGRVQLTWKDNYLEMGNILGIDLINNPDLALRHDIASTIMFEGMTRGTFTGKKLSDYFSLEKADWFNARRIINRLDRANEIGNYGKQFYTDILNAAGY